MLDEKFSDFNSFYIENYFNSFDANKKKLYFYNEIKTKKNGLQIHNAF